MTVAGNQSSQILWENGSLQVPLCNLELRRESKEDDKKVGERMVVIGLQDR